MTRHQARTDAGARHQVLPWGAVPSPRKLALLLGLTTLAIEALLAFRLWMQLSGDPLTNPALFVLYHVSSPLVEPFRSLEPTAPVSSETVLELSAMVAVQAYLLAAALLLTLLLAAARLFDGYRGGLELEFERGEVSPRGRRQPGYEPKRA